MKEILSKLVSRSVRKYLYGVAIAFIPLAISQGWMDIEAAPLMIPLIVAIFNLTPTPTPAPKTEQEEEITTNSQIFVE